MFFGINFFSFLIFSGIYKKEYLCRNISLFGILTFRERREAQLVLKILEVSTHISPKLQKNKAPFFHLGLSRKLFPCTRDFHWKVFGFVPSVRILILPKLPKGANTFDSCLYRNHVSVTKDFICSIKISSGNFLLLEGEAIELLNILIVASES